MIRTSYPAGSLNPFLASLSLGVGRLGDHCSLVGVCLLWEPGLLTSQIQDPVGVYLSKFYQVFQVQCSSAARKRVWFPVWWELNS